MHNCGKKKVNLSVFLNHVNHQWIETFKVSFNPVILIKSYWPHDMPFLRPCRFSHSLTYIWLDLQSPIFDTITLIGVLYVHDTGFNRTGNGVLSHKWKLYKFLWSFPLQKSNRIGTLLWKVNGSISFCKGPRTSKVWKSKDPKDPWTFRFCKSADLCKNYCSH